MVPLKGPSPFLVAALFGLGEVGFLEVREDFRDGGFGQIDADRTVDHDLQFGVVRPGHALELDVGTMIGPMRAAAVACPVGGHSDLYST